MELKIVSSKGSIVYQGVISNNEDCKEIINKFPPSKYLYKPTGKTICRTCGEAKECMQILDINLCVDCYKEFVQARQKLDKLRGCN